MSNFTPQIQPAKSQTFTGSKRAGLLLQRTCACGGSPGVSGECAECQKNYLQRKAVNSTKAIETPSIAQRPFFSPREPLGADTLTQPYFGHDFSRVQVHSRMPDVLPTLSMSGDSLGTIGSSGGLREVFINGPDEGSKPQPGAPPPVKKNPTPPAGAGSNCPSDIKVARVDPANDKDFGKNGFLTGWGGIALMEVSDPSGKIWDGTAIHENLKNIKNTCGDRGKKICSNESGERGGTAGSTFKVGEESNFLGMAKLAAVKNSFHDLHVVSTKAASFLHELKKENCEVQCQQSYDCGGKRFGPDFIITYLMTRDTVKSGARNIDVTRVEMRKAAAIKQAAPQGGKP